MQWQPKITLTRLTQELIEKLNEVYGDGLDDTEIKSLKGMKTVMQRHAEDAWQ